MSNMGTLNPTTQTTVGDIYLLRQGGIDYVQSREQLAASLANGRWIAEANYQQHTPVTGSNGLPYKAVQNSGVDLGGSVDPTTDTSETHWRLDLPEVLPLEGDWNGFLNPQHTQPLELEDTSAGTRAFTADAELAPNIYASGAGNITFADDGWIFTDGIYKQYTFTENQLALIEVDSVSVYVVDQAGGKHFVNNSTVGVTVAKVDATTLRVSLTSALLATLSITKVWRFFVTEKLGYIPELSPESPQIAKMAGVNVVSLSRAAGITYINPRNYPMEVTIVVYTALASTRLDGFLTIDGQNSTRFKTATTTGSGDRATLTAKIPPKKTYLLNLPDADTEMLYWGEQY